jgi:hypothetical protein
LTGRVRNIFRIKLEKKETIESDAEIMEMAQPEDELEETSEEPAGGDEGEI